MLRCNFAKSAVGLCGRAPTQGKSAAAGGTLSRWAGPPPPSVRAISAWPTFRNPPVKGPLLGVAFPSCCFAAVRALHRALDPLSLSPPHRRSSLTQPQGGWIGRWPVLLENSCLGGGVAGGLQNGHRASGAARQPCARHRSVQGCKSFPWVTQESTLPARLRACAKAKMATLWVQQLVVATIFASAARFSSRLGQPAESTGKFASQRLTLATPQPPPSFGW